MFLVRTDILKSPFRHKSRVLYIISNPLTHTMSSASLVWSLESVILGLWAVVFSIYSTPLHAFIARCHVLAASFTLLLHLVASARSLDVVCWAASQAFLCLVSALCVCYCVALADPNNPRYFALPFVDGLFPLDACIGISWLLAALVSSLGMALVPSGGRKSSLMLHYYGYHLIVMAPSVLLLLPSTVLSIASIVLWILHISILFGLNDTKNSSAFIKTVVFIGRLSCVAVSTADVVYSGGLMRFVVSVVLLVISILDQFDWIGSLEDIVLKKMELSSSSASDIPIVVSSPPVPTLQPPPPPARFQSRDPAAIGMRNASTTNKRHLSP